MNIILTFALPSEYRPLSFPGLHIVFTGIGMRRSQDRLRELLAMPADLCIASGLAGSLKSQHAVGSVLVARGIKAETDKTILTSDGALVDAAARCGAKPVDFFYTSKAVVNSDSERSRLAMLADAVDMESFHVLAQAGRAGVPAVAVRAVSDSPARHLPIDFNRVIDQRGELSWLSVAGELVRHPARIGSLVKFGIQSSRASRALAGFLNKYAEQVSR